MIWVQNTFTLFNWNYISLRYENMFWTCPLIDKHIDQKCYNYIVYVLANEKKNIDILIKILRLSFQMRTKCSNIRILDCFYFYTAMIIFVLMMIPLFVFSSEEGLDAQLPFIIDPALGWGHPHTEVSICFKLIY